MSDVTRPLGLFRKLREQWTADLERYLTRIDPALVSGGKLSRKSLPIGTLIDRGEYNENARYARGDLIVADGAAYVATGPSTGALPTDTAAFQPLGGTSGGVTPVPPPYAYLTDTDGAYLIDGDGAYLYEPI